MYAGGYYPYDGSNQSSNNFQPHDSYLPYNNWPVPLTTQSSDMSFSSAQTSESYCPPMYASSLVVPGRQPAPSFIRSQTFPGQIPSSHLHQPSPQYQYQDPSFLQPSERSSASPSLSTTNTLSSTAESSVSIQTSGQKALKFGASQPSTSPAPSLAPYGIPLSPNGPWRCAFPNCNSRALFTRGCDLRKHYNRHSKHLFCRVEGCPQSEPFAMAAGADPKSNQSIRGVGTSVGNRFIPYGQTHSVGFSSKKDRARHEAKHNPSIRCEWSADTDEYGKPRDPLPGESRQVIRGESLGEAGNRRDACGRVFSRMDNMKDHVRRVHKKGLAERPRNVARRRT